MQIGDPAIALVLGKDDVRARDGRRQAFDRPMRLSHRFGFRREWHEDHRLEAEFAKLFVQVDQSRPFGEPADLAGTNVDEDRCGRVRSRDGVQHWAEPRQLLGGMSGCSVCIAYETVTSSSGGLPLLTPMSEVAGRLAPQVGAHALEKEAGGRGVLLGGVPGAPAADVLIIGGGVAGTNAAMIALGMGAQVTLLDRSLDVLRRLTTQFNGRVRTIFSTCAAIADLVTKADLVIGAVLVPGAAAPKFITRTMLKTMKQGSVLVDIAIDQGGCAETSKPTTHSNPTFVVDGVVHYCVTNMPGAVARTSTFALNNATLPFTLQLADKGWRQALKDAIHLHNGLNVCDRKITCKPVAEAHGLAFTPADAFID